MESIQRLFESVVQKMPATTAIDYQLKKISYLQLNEIINQLSHYLSAVGVGRETRVAIALERNPQVIRCMIAVVKAGGCYVPLDSTTPTARLLHILNSSNTPFLITQKSMLKKFKEFTGEIIVIDDIDTRTFSKENPLCNAKKNDLAYVIYTSGSTGEPKGVLIEQENVLNYSENFVENCLTENTTRIDFSANYAFDMAVTTTLVALLSGLTIVITDDKTKKDCHNYLSYLRDNKINILKITPSYFKVLLYEIERNTIDLPDLRLILLGGEKLHTLDCARWHKKFPEHALINEYGPTETTVGVTWYKFSNHGINAIHPDVPIGKPGKNCAFYLVDKNKLVAEGEIGELYIGGRCVGRGYLNNPQLSEERFVLKPFHKGYLYQTGDLCRQLSDGNYEYLGRIDHQVKIRGFRIELGEIEAWINKFPAVKSSIVTAVSKNRQEDEKQLIAYYLLTDNTSSINIDQLKKHLKKHLIQAMIPVLFVKIDNLPLNANGKLDLKKLPKTRVKRKSPRLQILSKLESKIARIWQQELRISSVNAHDNFFELGGHSLIAARIVTTLKYGLKKEITVSDFYNHCTISELACFLKNSPTIARVAIPKSSSPILALNDFQFLLWLADNFEPNTKKINIVGQLRFEGIINPKRLSQALECLIRKQPVLMHRVLKYQPALKFQPTLTRAVELFDLRGECSWVQKIQESYTQLINFHPWPKTKILLKIRLFLLPHDVCELQIALPHLISDGQSVDLIFQNLSSFYLKELKSSKQNINFDLSSYKTLIAQEKRGIAKNYSRDRDFWRNYFQNTNLLCIDQNYIIPNMRTARCSYSTYKSVSKKFLTDLYDCGAHLHLNINTLLIASVATALAKTVSLERNNSIFFNIVKSCRDDCNYDNTLGCFISVEPISIQLKNKRNLDHYVNQVHQQLILTQPYQGASAVVKYASLNKIKNKMGAFKWKCLKFLGACLATVFPSSHLNADILASSAKLSAFKQRKEFMVNINTWDNFNPSSNGDEHQILFGLNQKSIPVFEQDLLSLDYILDVSFIKSYNCYSLVVSGNLQPEFRQKLTTIIVEELMSFTKATTF